MTKSRADQLRAAERLLAIRKSRESLLDFTMLTMPDPLDPDDATRSLYEVAVHHKLICEALEKVEKGAIDRLIITMPPRHGKSELASRRFVPWCMGRNPNWQVIFSTYSSEFAEDFGRTWRDIMRSPSYRQIFPETRLKTGAARTDRIETTGNGIIVAVGARGAITGRGANLFVIDDPIKNEEEAESPTIRERRWAWFAKVAFTRLMPDGRVVVIMTRWHDDDIVGRLRDRERMGDMVDNWEILDLPAISAGPDGRERALWPEKYPIRFLREVEALDKRAFSALYQQRPTPDDGLYFSDGDFIPYHGQAELPKNMRIFAASDHAPGAKQNGDYNVLGGVGVDENDEVWILPDLIMKRMQTDDTVEHMIDLMRRRRPQFWWAENEHIMKSIGPFLRKRMREEMVGCTIVPVTPTKDKQTRARSAQGLVSLGVVHVPVYAHWWAMAKQQLMTFPYGQKDDFVDWFSLIGLGLDTIIGPRSSKDEKKSTLQHAPGTFGYLKTMAGRKSRRDAAAKAAAVW